MAHQGQGVPPCGPNSGPGARTWGRFATGRPGSTGATAGDAGARGSGSLTGMRRDLARSAVESEESVDPEKPVARLECVESVDGWWPRLAVVGTGSVSASSSGWMPGWVSPPDSGRALSRAPGERSRELWEAGAAGEFVSHSRSPAGPAPADAAEGESGAVAGWSCRGGESGVAPEPTDAAAGDCRAPARPEPSAPSECPCPAADPELSALPDCRCPAADREPSVPSECRCPAAGPEPSALPGRRCPAADSESGAVSVRRAPDQPAAASPSPDQRALASPSPDRPVERSASSSPGRGPAFRARRTPVLGPAAPACGHPASSSPRRPLSGPGVAATAGPWPVRAVPVPAPGVANASHPG
ncbi:hypothetical protein ACRJ4B_19010 [Streptomyces sp. GTA36]